MASPCIYRPAPGASHPIIKRMLLVAVVLVQCIPIGFFHHTTSIVLVADRHLITLFWISHLVGGNRNIAQLRCNRSTPGLCSHFFGKEISAIL